MGFRARSSLPPAPEATTALGMAAEALAPGGTVEFASGAIPDAIADNSNERTAYWNTKFYWDATRREAQAIAIGTGFTRMTHLLYSAEDNAWSRVTPFDAPTVLGCPSLGHPYSWHCMTPDGTYWLKLSTREELAFRRRADWSIMAWSALDKTPAWTTPSTAWPESLEWHDAMGKAVFRIGSTVITLDVLGYLHSGTLSPQQLPIAPATTESNKAAMGYCRALGSLICFSAGVGQPCYRIRADGSMQTLGPVPRWVMNGNVSIDETQVDSRALYVDDPLGLTGYLLERQPTDSLLANRVWRMNNVGSTWDGTWSEIGTHGLFHAVRSDGRPPGGTALVCAIPEYGVVWALRQRDVDYIDSFLWKPGS